MGELIRVGMADMNICRAPDRITTLGLGSCIGLVLFDIGNAVCGMIHIMLPDSTQFANNTNIPKFADTGAKELVRIIVAAGANRSRLVAKIAGGAQMFAFQNKTDLTNVGQRNVDAVKAVLAELKIPILASDTGLNFGRTVEFYPETGDYIIKAVGKGVKTI